MTGSTELPSGVTELLARSNRLGSDPTVTNYGGGNTSVKVRQLSPATGAEVELLYVKGSGGDLGTLQAGGLAVLELDRVRALDGVYRGVDFEDEMVGLLPVLCLRHRGSDAVDRHPDARPGRLRPRRPPAPRRRHRAGLRRRRRGSGREDLGRNGGLGSVEATRLGTRAGAGETRRRIRT